VPSEPSAAPTTVTAEEFRQSLPQHTVESLQDTSSPQYGAYEWVTTTDQVPRDVAPSDKATTLFRMTQRFALATLLYSMNLASLVKSTISECHWSNVTCTADSRVTTLALEGNGGTVPREVGLLTGLTSLVIDGNYPESYLTSTIPTELGQLTGLLYLSIFYGELTSMIPTELGLLFQLASLILSWNQLTSSIPTELGQLVGLTHLDLSSNQLSSPIPTELGYLTGLTLLDLWRNQLTSTIPTELGRLSALEYLWLVENRLTGTFPAAICQFSHCDSTSPRVDCAEVACRCCFNCSQ
jgi:Leucine-rich repeat (LRR) protein